MILTPADYTRFIRLYAAGLIAWCEWVDICNRMMREGENDA